MSFASVPFVVLLLVAVPLHWALGCQRLRLVVLFAASLVFYAHRHWPSLALLLASIAFNFVMGRVLERHKHRAVLALAIGVNLLGLAFFKYAGFLAQSLMDLFSLVGIRLDLPVPSPWLPLGISFFTFQVVAYLVDVWRGQLPAERSLLAFAVFKSFLGQLIAGPIVKGAVMFPQLKTLRPWDARQFHQGLWLVGLGVWLKLGVADVLAPFVSHTDEMGAEAGINEAWLAAASYSAQLFADFWGYSTVAVGTGLLFGLHLPFNFETPYLATSLQKFWRRWHITLSNWFRDMVYLPMGGNRRRWAWNLLLTMSLAGLWHGAGWNFVVWGALHGLWLIAERIAAQRIHIRLPHAVAALTTFLVVTLLWVPFRAPSIAAAGSMWRAMLLPPFHWQQSVPAQWPIWLGLFFLLHRWLDRAIREERLLAWPLWRQVLLACALVWVVVAYGGPVHDFIYFVF